MERTLRSNLECGDLSPLSQPRLVAASGKAPTSRRTPKRVRQLLLHSRARQVSVFSVSLWLIFSAGCATAPNPAHARGAKALFESTVRTYHFPSALATGTDRDRLLSGAGAGYERLLRQYPDQDDWCAKSLRSLGNVRATQGQLAAAVKLYSQVAEQHPRQDWEILQSWKSAADLLWEAGRPAEAQKFYRLIVARFDQPNPTAMVKLIVHTAKVRLQ